MKTRSLAILCLFMFCSVGGYAAGQFENHALSLMSATTNLISKPVNSKQENLTAGDHVVLEISVPNSYKDAVPEFIKKLESGPVEWGAGRILSWKKINGEPVKFLVTLTCYTPGPFEIKPIHFHAPDATGLPSGDPLFVSETKSVEFSKIPEKKDESGLGEKLSKMVKAAPDEEPAQGDAEKEAEEDIFPPEKVPLPKWVSVVAMLFLALIIIGIIKLIADYQKRKSGKTVSGSVAPVLSPIELFEQTRRSVDIKRYVDDAKYKPHYFALSDAAKKFLGSAYHFDAEDKTTRELSSAMEEVGVPESLRTKWSEIMTEMDETKFTDGIPDRERASTLSARISEIAGQSWRLSPEYREQMQILKEKK